MKKIITILILASAAVCVFAGTTLTSSIRVMITTALANSGAMSTARDSGVVDYSRTLDSGTGSGQCDMIYQAQVSIGAGATTSLDLQGSLANALGGPVTFGHVKMLYLRNLSDTASMTMGGNIANVWESWGGASGTISIPANGEIMMFAPLSGWAVTTGTADILAITNGGPSVASCNISLLGTSL